MNATAMASGYEWNPISNLPERVGFLTDGELDALKLVWQEQRQALSTGGALEQFSGRLGREWAIETGIIERVYDLDRGTTRTLIEHGIRAALIPHTGGDKSPELIARIIQDHVEALEGLFAFVRGERALTVGYIRQLHAALLRNQDTFTVVDQLGRAFEKELHKGEYKTFPNSPTRPDGVLHEYCPPEHVAAEMDRLVEFHAGHVERGFPVEVTAAWLHHAFTQIHPFEDGNGRVARAIATIVFIKAEWFPLMIRSSATKYVEALERADQGDLRALVALFVQSQRTSLFDAMDLGFEVKPPKTPEEAIAAAHDQLVNVRQLPLPEWNVSKSTAQHLWYVTRNRLTELEPAFKTEIGAFGSNFNFQIKMELRTVFAKDVIVRKISSSASELGYSANLDELHHWVELSLTAPRVSEIFISLHAVGLRYRGVIAAMVLYGENGKDPVLVSEDSFQVNYLDHALEAESRYRSWLEANLTKALMLWRKSL